MKTLNWIWFGILLVFYTIPRLFLWFMFSAEDTETDPYKPGMNASQEIFDYQNDKVKK